MIQLNMLLFKRATRAIQPLQRQAGLITCLIVIAWLALVQPGMSYFWLIDPALHAEIDKELYGQLPDGETLPGHEHHPAHEHPTSEGTTVPELTFANPFDAAYYQSLLAAAQRPALRGELVEMNMIARSLAIEPPDQPPRA
jgi:hypothetical protein